MAWNTGYPVNFVADETGDKTNAALQKHILEFTRLYGIITALMDNVNGHKHDGTADTGGEMTTIAHADEATEAEHAATAGLAATATKLATARKISLTGAVAGNVYTDGSADVSIATTLIGTDNRGMVIYEPNPQIYGTVYEGQTSGSKAIGATSITLDGCTPSAGTFLAGQRILFGSGTQEYVIQSSVTCVSGACTIEILPALVSSLSDNVLVVLATGVEDRTDTFTVPEGVTSCIVTCVGGGGGGATGDYTFENTTSQMRFSGGAGDVAYRKLVSGLTPGQVINITIGGGGNGGHPWGTNNATAGNTSSFGGYVSAGGGGKATPSSGNNQGSGGSAGGLWANNGTLSSAANSLGAGNFLTFSQGTVSVFEDTRVGFGGQGGNGASPIGSSTNNPAKIAGQAGMVIVEW